jgi:hypothetical protein
MMYMAVLSSDSVALILLGSLLGSLYVPVFDHTAFLYKCLSRCQDVIGLLEREKLGFFFEIWKDLTDGKAPVIPPGTRKTRIRSVRQYMHPISVN